ncbi:MAG TPA: DUF1564 family protein [Leptospiraceae bacterium]|nr:DUF1564 family protein [Leptospiraceae bacterium]HMW07222.1 DUF1564 family protein [Leptospiraceae bacterium]HMX33075.1 DUF1564 family protein [Leptospiraceae bacterium]HMY32628.1 DUF1564 family protein [Leptospiraceae bacterium]HMZ63745.1 DUF1564 family protein [Leptospiraceae bacterium]
MFKKFHEPITLSNSKLAFPRNDFNLSEFSSTILIPERYLELFFSKAKKHTGVRNYIAYLLSKYQLFIANGLIPGCSNITTKYQDKGQNLQKVSFRPKPEDWAELKLYRVSFGMSISAFLVYLLIADSVDLVESLSDYLGGVGISIPPHFDLCAKVYLTQKRTNYTIFFQYRKERKVRDN